jgi:hypothetical protein
MELNNFGKNLKFGPRRRKNKTISEKEIFVEMITCLSKCWDDSNEIYDKFKISLLEYEEGYYQIIEDLMLLKYGLWKTELILWYVFGRKDKDGEIHPLTIKIKEKDDEDVYLKSSLDLWNLLEQLEEQKRKDEESEK